MNIYKLSFVALIFLFSPLSNLYAKQVTINNNGDWVSEVKKLKPGDTAVFTKGRFGTGTYSTATKLFPLKELIINRLHLLDLAHMILFLMVKAVA